MIAILILVFGLMLSVIIGYYLFERPVTKWIEQQLKTDPINIAPDFEKYQIFMQRMEASNSLFEKTNLYLNEGYRLWQSALFDSDKNKHYSKQELNNIHPRLIELVSKYKGSRIEGNSWNIV